PQGDGGDGFRKSALRTRFLLNPSYATRCETCGFHTKREVPMNRNIAGILITMSILATSLGTAQAQNTAAIDAALRGAVERKDIPGVVGLVTDRQRVIYQGAFGVA